jgi:hypothetical protein
MDDFFHGQPGAEGSGKIYTPWGTHGAGVRVLNGPTGKPSVL